MRDIEKRFEELTEHLAKLPDRCQLIMDFLKATLDDEDDKEAQRYVVPIYGGWEGSIYLLLSSSCAPLMFDFEVENEYEMFGDTRKLLDLLAFDMFGAYDFEDELGKPEQGRVLDTAREILDKALKEVSQNESHLERPDQV